MPRRQQIVSRAVNLHGRGNHVLRRGTAAILNGNRSIAIDCVDVDTARCSGIKERVGGSHCQRLRGNPVVIRGAGENRKSPSAVDAESGKVRIASIADIKIVARVAAAATVGLRNKKTTPGHAEKQQTAQSPYSAHALSLTCTSPCSGDSKQRRSKDAVRSSNKCGQ